MIKTIRYAKYLRYSRAHDDKEPDSIKSQQSVIDIYISERTKDCNENWVLEDVYIDIDYTGANFMRPEFLRMKKSIEDGNIDVVISKDASRFGRNVATEVYFSELFPKFGVSFIGVADQIDTSDDRQAILRQIQGVMNENYCRDISMKVRSALRAKKAEGKYTGSTVPYGFLRDPNDKHKLIVDETVRPVILRIAKLYLQGNGYQTVAKILNEDPDGPPCPSLYKKQIGINYHNSNASRGLWSISTIRKILTHEVYNGTLVQHMAEVINFKVKKKRNVPKEQQIRVEGAVEKIIDDETWALIQKRVGARSKVVKNSHTPALLPGNLYSGVLFCNDCGSQMAYRSDRDIYLCSTYAKYSKKYCTNHYIKTDTINTLVLKQLEEYNRLTIEVRSTLKDLKQKYNEKTQQNIAVLETTKLQKRIEVIESTLKVLREEHAAGDIKQDEYKRTRDEYTLELEEIQTKLGALAGKSKKVTSIFSGWEERIEDIEKAYEKFFTLNNLERELIVRLVDRITIREDGSINEITFNAESPFELAKELSNELSAVSAF